MGRGYHGSRLVDNQRIDLNGRGSCPFRGLLELDQPIAAYWPEFARNGKSSITVRQLMSHQAGLCALDAPLTIEDVSDPDKLAAVLVRQRPAWEPGTRQGYHAVTFGWYVGELIRRVDPKYRSLGRFFHEEIAEPLGIDFFIGLPATIPGSRIAMIKEFGFWSIVSGMATMPFRASLGFLSPKSVVKRAFATPVPKTLDLVKRKREYMAVEGPGYNGVGSARGIAKAYSVFATGAKELSLKRESLEALTDPAPQPSGGAVDLITCTMIQGRSPCGRLSKDALQSSVESGFPQSGSGQKPPPRPPFRVVLLFGPGVILVLIGGDPSNRPGAHRECHQIRRAIKPTLFKRSGEKNMDHYEIIVQGHLDARRAEYFEEMEMKLLPDGVTLITGHLRDQAELHAMLSRIRDMGITLVSVKLLGPDARRAPEE